MGGSDCELLRDGWLAQPVNAWSSVAFVVAAVFVLVRRRPPDRWSLMPVASAGALALVGIGSFAFHGPQPSWAEPLHDVAIAVLVAVVLVDLLRRRRVPPSAVLTFAAGVVVFVLGRTDGPLCAPASLVQLHAAWHVLSAAGAALALGFRDRAEGRGSVRR